MQPQTLDQLAMISGVGQKKLEKWGRGFLEVISSQADCSDSSAPRDERKARMPNEASLTEANVAVPFQYQERPEQDVLEGSIVD